jgi:CPA1 family monovalent cation:H+ antiporter
MAAPKRLAAVVGGESLLNDGTSIVITTLFLELALGGPVEAGEVVFFIFNQLFFSTLFGVAMGLASLVFIRIVRNDSNTLTTFIIAVPFLTFVVATYFFGSSGVLAIVPLCVMLNEYGRGMLMEVRQHFEKHKPKKGLTLNYCIFSLTAC